MLQQRVRLARTTRAGILAAAALLSTVVGCTDATPTLPNAAMPATITRPHPSLAVTGADYTITTLANPGSTLGIANAVNDQGHAAGAEYGVLSFNQGYTEYYWGQPSVPTPVVPCCGQVGSVNNYDELTGFGTKGSVGGAPEAYVWTPGMSQVVYIGVSNGIALSFAFAVNDAGQVVGRGGPDNSSQHALLWQPSSVRGTTFSVIDLGTLPGDATSEAHFVNASGQIVGQSFDAAGHSHAVLWQPSAPGASTYTPVDIGTLGGAAAEAWQINAGGQIVGNSTASDGTRHAFLWTPAAPNGTTGTMADLGAGAASGVSDNGIVTGNDASNTRAWVWTAVSGTSDLPTPSGTQAYSATISRTGVISGRYTDACCGTQHPAIWQLNNLPPVADAGGSVTGVEGSAVTFDGSASHDPNGDALTYSWSFSDGGSASGAVVQHVFVDNGSYTATLTVTDAKGATSVATTTATIADVAPTLYPFTPNPLGPVPVGTSIAVMDTIADPGTLDTQTAQVNWDDGAGFQAASAFGAITGNPANGYVVLNAARAYTQAGVYAIQLNSTDKDGLTSPTVAAGTGTGASFVPQYVVVYDPSGGFVTGGGWIMSPAGAYAANPALTGKATFGFVAKYLPGATTPSGHTEFDFHVANLTFQSTSYQWLVVSGALAQYKGTGTINGTGSYGFLLTATDGQVSGGGGVDKFRIKIWDTATGSVLYDNQMGQSDSSGAGTALGGGSIVIQK